MATFYEEDRTPVALQQIAPVMRQAQLAIEGHRFYQHGALDIRGTVRQRAAPPHPRPHPSLTNLIDRACYLAIATGTETITADLLAVTNADNAAHTNTRTR